MFNEQMQYEEGKVILRFKGDNTWMDSGRLERDGDGWVYYVPDECGNTPKRFSAAELRQIADKLDELNKGE